MDLTVMTTRQLLEKKLGAAKAAIFINGLKNIYRYSKYYGDCYEDLPMRKLLSSVIVNGR